MCESILPSSMQINFLWNVVDVLVNFRLSLMGYCLA